MSFIAGTTHLPVGLRGQLSGALYFLPADFSTSKRLHFPPACAAIDHPFSGQNYGNRQYLVGAHTANLVIDEELRVHRQGMSAPNTLPSVAVGGGTTVQIVYNRFYDELTRERSPLSDGTTVTGNTTRTHSSLPTEVPNEQIIIEGTATFVAGTVTGVKTNFTDLRPGDRVAVSTALTRWTQVRSVTSDTSMVVDDTAMADAGVTLVAKPVSRASHVETWVAVSGALPRLSARVRIGTTTFVESVATLALGEAETVSFTAMPYGSMNVFYGDRQFVAGVEGHRDHVYASAIGFPERHEGLSFFTPYNEPIVGLLRYRDYVILLCPDSSYKLQGYTVDDYERSVLDAEIGGLGHSGNRVAEGRAFIPGRKGMQIFNGAFHPGIPTRRSEWSADYLANLTAWEYGFSAVNPNDGTYQFYPVASKLVSPYGQKAWVYVAQYDAVGPAAGGGITNPEWLSDRHDANGSTNKVTFAAYLTPSGQKVGKMYRGTDTGKILEENEDDSVAFTGTSIIVTRHDVMGDFGGAKGEGKRIIRHWSYVESEFTAWEARVWPGDERAYPPDQRQGAPNAVRTLIAGGDDVAASASSGTFAGYTIEHEALTVHHHIVEKNACGRGFSFEFRFTNPRAVKFYGLGGVWEPGPTSRPVVTAAIIA